MRRLEKLAVLILLTLGFCGCASTKSAESDARASSEKQEKLTDVTHSETKLSEHEGPVRIYRYFFRGGTDAPHGGYPGRGDDRSGADAGMDAPPALSEYEVEVRDGVDRTFQGSSEGTAGLEVQAQGEVDTHAQSASKWHFGLPWYFYVAGVAIAAALAAGLYGRYLRPYLVLMGVLK